MREKLIELQGILRKCLHYNFDDFTCQMALDVDLTAENLIANGVTIPVRCKDCKYLEKGDRCRVPLGIGLCDDQEYIFVDKEDFCSCGERRNDG